jgi:hypothetical protein
VFEEVEHVFLWFSPMIDEGLLGEFVEWPCDGRVVLDEILVVVAET